MKQHFKREHDHMRVMLADYTGMMGSRTEPDIADVMRRRLAFSNMFRAHVAGEAPAFDALRTGRIDHPADRLLDEHGCRLRAVMPGYSALIRDWTPARIVADWPTYCREVRAQVKVYLEFLDWEEAHVLPLFDHARDRAHEATVSASSRA